MAEPIDVVDALARLAVKREDYATYWSYYRGDHETRFASDAYKDTFGRLMKRMRYNRCATVVDSTANRLQIAGWQSADAGPNDSTEVGDVAEKRWAAIRGAYVQGLVHVEALRSGDAYVLVWPKADNDAEPLWTVYPAHTCQVIVDDDTMEPILAMRCWQINRGPDAGKWRLTIFDTTAITRWISRDTHEKQQPTKAAQFVPFEDGDGFSGPNPYGTIPLIHFPNNPQFQGDLGISELDDVIPLQDGLNYSVWQLMIAGEFVGWPMRYATGMSPNIDPITGENMDTVRSAIDRFLQIADPEANVGQLIGADMRPFIDVQDSWDQKISRVSQVPVHWLGMTGSFPSGESLKTAEAPFVAKLKDRQLGFTDGWERAMRLDLRISKQGGDESQRVAPVWTSPEPRTDQETWSLAQLKQAVGIPAAQIWREAGYSEEQIEEMTAENERIRQQQAELFGRAFDQGTVDEVA